MAEGAMAGFLAGITAFFTECLTWISSLIGVITENPALTVMVLAMPIAGVAVGYLGRLIRL